MSDFDRASMRAAIGAGRVHWRLHVLQRMPERGIERAEVLIALATGEVIESYPETSPYPSALVLGLVDGRPLHIVVALDAPGAEAYVITVYEPSPERFEPGWRRRKQR